VYGPPFLFCSMLQLNSLASPSEIYYVHFPEDVTLNNLSMYDMTLVNVATGVASGTTNYIAGVTTRRTTEVRFTTYQLALGMYIAEFKDDRGEVILQTLCYASPGGNSPSPGRPYYPTTTESITIYYE